MELELDVIKERAAHPPKIKISIEHSGNRIRKKKFQDLHLMT